MRRIAATVLALLTIAACGGGSGGTAFEKRISRMSDCNALESEREQENTLRLTGDSGATAKMHFVHDRMVKVGC